MEIKKANLSSQNLSIINDTSFLLHKQEATKTIYELFAIIKDDLKCIVDKTDVDFPMELDKVSGKISKGENYKDLPFIILDFPKLFSTDSVMAFRTMFWWGHEFSFTMHLQGYALQKFRAQIIKNIHKLKNTDTYFCVGDTPWNYHFEKDNYCDLNDIDPDFLLNQLNEKTFIKLSRKLTLNEWEILPAFTRQSFEYFISLLC